MNNETPEDRTARSPEDTFRRLKRVPIDHVLRIITDKYNGAPITAQRFIELAQKEKKFVGVDKEHAPDLEGTGWTIDELNQELQRMYDYNS